MNYKEKQKLKTLIVEVVKEEMQIKESVFKAFLEPFADVVKTARAGIERVAAVGVTELFKNIKLFALVFVPFVSYRVGKEIREKANRSVEEKLSKIDSKYADVYERNFEAFKKTDIFPVAFMLNPQMALTSQVTKKVASEALETMDTLVGGSKLLQSIKEKLNKITAAGGIEIPDTSNLDSIFGFESFGESKKLLKHVLYEQEEKNFVKANEVEQYVLNTIVPRIQKNKNFQNKVEQNPINKSLKQSGKEIILGDISQVMKIKTYDELKKHFGNEFEKYEKELKTKLPKDISDQDLAKFKEKLVPEIQETYKEMFIKQLESENITPDIQKLIEQIKAM